jgi:hypothetical protein
MLLKTFTCGTSMRVVIRPFVIRPLRIVKTLAGETPVPPRRRNSPETAAQGEGAGSTDGVSGEKKNKTAKTVERSQ